LETSLDSSVSSEETTNVAELVVAEPATVQTMAEALPVRWNPFNRILFRIAFIYFFIFCFMYGNGSIFSVFPFVGQYLDKWMTWPFHQAALWVGHRYFHLSGLFGTFHPTGSGDTALDWVLQLLYASTAVVGGLAWTAISGLWGIRGNRRVEYSILYAWLRFAVRMSVGFFMLTYGFAKVFPLQMAPVSIGILNEPVGQMSPQTMLWAMLGLNPLYEIVCGAAEVLGGVLLLFRRTALAGTLLSAFVMTNVLLYNMFFDVPVKLFAANLLLAELFLILPDAKSLFGYFWLHTPSAPGGVWVPPLKRKGFRIATLTVEIVLCVGFLGLLPFGLNQRWQQVRAANAATSPLLGAWHVDAAHPATGAFITGEGLPTTDLYVDTVIRAFRRSSNLQLWRTTLKIDDKAHTIRIGYFGGSFFVYAYQMPDANHLVLVSQPPKADPQTKLDPKAKPFVSDTVTLTRTPIPAHYPLLDRGFHWVNEWGFER
jgi:hypothetical protein